MRSLVLVVVLAFPVVALAQQPAPQPAPQPTWIPPQQPPPYYPPPPALVVEAPPYPSRSVSVTLSPVHLILPVVEVMGEVKVAPKLGVAAIVGAGKLTMLDVDMTIFELGGQAAYYVLGGFDRRSSLQLGAEVMYLSVSGESTTTNETAFVEGMTVGPYLGYKFVGQGGFTFVGQFGYQWLTMRGESSDGDTADDRDGGVLLNLNLGWSF